MKYLILGSAGQVGAALVKKLTDMRHHVETFDIVDSDLEDLRLFNNKVLDEKLDSADFVFFLAFDVGGSPYLKKHQHTFDFLNNNMLIMSNTFKKIKEKNKKFIFTSSQMSNMDFSPYGLAKAIGEQYTKSLEGLTVKFWNIYGPEKDLEKSHVITNFILKAKNTKSIHMLSDGLETRQFLHVDDCCDCLYLLSQQYDDLNKDKQFHITSFKWNSILEVARIISSHYDNVDIIPSPTKDEVQKNIQNQPSDYILNFWQPKIDLRSGILKIIYEMEQ